MIIPSKKFKVALIVGGTGGIGSAIARAFGAEGCRVIVTGKDATEVRRFTSRHPNFDAKPLDVSDNAAVKRVVGELDRLDILVNCAGKIQRGNCEHDPKVFDEVVDVNLSGTMRLCAACRPLLKKSRGCILNVASMLSFFGSGFVPAYSASKGGVAQLTKSLAIAWASEGIRVNAIAPGWIETAMTRVLREDKERSRAIIERTPMKRWGKPKDVAGAALFLCSPEASFITGVILPVDGGYLCS